MKASLSLLALCQLAAIVLTTNAHAAAVDVKKRGVYVQTPTCNRGDSHCIYMTNAYTYGPADVDVRCRGADRQGRGTDACQLPNVASAIVSCYGDVTSYVSVQFGFSSTFIAHGRATAQWSSKIRNGDDDFGDHDGSTEENGDDLYVRC